MRTWTRTWATLYGAGTAAQLAVMPFVDRGTREDLAVGAATSALGLAFTVIAPPAVAADADALDAQPCELAAQNAQRLLAHAADEEASGVAWPVHLANGGLNVAAGLFLGLAYHRWLSGALTAGTGTLVGELQLFTQPTGLEGDLQRLRDGTFTRVSFAVRPISEQGRAAGLAVSFVY